MIETYFVQVFISSIVVSLVITVLALIKTKLGKHIATQWQYNIDLLFLVLLAVPLIPGKILKLVNWNNWFSNNSPFVKNSLMHASSTIAASNSEKVTPDWIQDFSLSVNRLSSHTLITVLIAVWIVGMILFSIVTFLCHRRIKHFEHSASIIESGTIINNFNRCKVDLNSHHNIPILASTLVQTPMTIGVLKPRIMLPSEILSQLSEDDIYHILLHELTHCKKGDLWINQFLCAFQIIYWFNPLVIKVFREIRINRETACDASVLSKLNEENYVAYGLTILNFIGKMSQLSRFTNIAAMGGSKQQITKRIEMIASFSVSSKSLKRKSIVAFALVIILIITQIPIISAFALDSNNRKFEFKADKVIKEDLSKYFSDFEGSFVLYDVSSEQYTIYNREKSVERLSPDSTYKLYSALFALDSGVIHDDASIIKWDGTSYPFDNWNQNQDLSSAMTSSVSWYFQSIDKKVGQKKLRSNFEKIAYGNCDLSGGIRSYWQESSLRISPVEQVQLLTKFYKEELPFSSEHIATIKKVIKLSETDNTRLSGKTGSGIVNGKGVNGWFIGFIEQDNHTYVFATNIQDKSQANGSTAADITLKILADKGLYNPIL